MPFGHPFKYLSTPYTSKTRAQKKCNAFGDIMVWENKLFRMSDDDAEDDVDDEDDEDFDEDWDDEEEE